MSSKITSNGLHNGSQPVHRRGNNNKELDPEACNYFQMCLLMAEQQQQQQQQQLQSSLMPFSPLQGMAVQQESLAGGRQVNGVSANHQLTQNMQMEQIASSQSAGQDQMLCYRLLSGPMMGLIMQASLQQNVALVQLIPKNQAQHNTIKKILPQLQQQCDEGDCPANIELMQCIMPADRFNLGYK